MNSAVLALVAVSVVFAVLSFASRNVLFMAAREIEYRLRGELFAHLQRMPQSYFAGQRTGDLMSRAVNDVNNVRMFLGMGLLNIVQTPVLYVGAIAVMLHVDWRLTLWVLVAVSAVHRRRALLRAAHAPGDDRGSGAARPALLDGAGERRGRLRRALERDGALASARASTWRRAGSTGRCCTSRW